MNYTGGFGMKTTYTDIYRGATVLITGGAGAIGSNLSLALSALGANVVVLDDFSSAEPWNLPKHAALSPIRGSILDQESMSRAFAQRPRIVFHLAAMFANQNSVEHPESDLMVNGLGTLRVLQYSHLAAVDRVVFTSTSCSVYGDKAPLPLTEEFMAMEPTTPYQVTKTLGELYCNFFRNSYGLSTVRVRLFNSYGPGEIPGRYRNVVPNFIFWAMQQQPLSITGSGEETRDWTYVDDIVDGLLRAGAVPGADGDVFNLASGKETRVIDLANCINRLTGNGAGVVYTERRKWDVHTHRLASVEKARNILGYEPRTELEDGLSRTVAWFKQNWPALRSDAKF